MHGCFVYVERCAWCGAWWDTRCGGGRGAVSVRGAGHGDDAALLPSLLQPPSHLSLGCPALDLARLLRLGHIVPVLGVEPGPDEVCLGLLGWWAATGPPTGRGAVAAVSLSIVCCAWERTARPSSLPHRVLFSVAQFLAGSSGPGQAKGLQCCLGTALATERLPAECPSCWRTELLRSRRVT